MKKIKKLLLGCALPLAALTIATPIIATSCSVTPARIVKTEWKSNLNDDEGFTLNSTKEELIFDAKIDSIKIRTLDEIEASIYGKKTDGEIDKNTVSELVKNNIVNSDKFNIKVDDVQKDSNNRIAIFKFLLTSKDDLEISNLIFRVKNYSIPGTWLKTAIKKDFINHLSNNARDLNVDISNVNNGDWHGLDKDMDKQAIKNKIFETTSGREKESPSNNDLKQEFKILIDKNDQYNFSVIDDDNNTGNTLTFTIILTKKPSPSRASNQESTEGIKLKLIVTNNKDNWT